MASMGSGYDLSVATFSPDGRVFQVEYASKVIEATGLALGGVFRDGALLAVDKYLASSLVEPSTNTRVFQLAPHVICAVTGSLPDARRLIKTCRTECSEYQRVWGLPIPGNVLAERVGLFVHAHTAVWSTRPFGCALLLAVAESSPLTTFPGSRLPDVTQDNTMGDASPPRSAADYSLYVVDPTGAAYKYRATALAKGNQSAKSDLEKLKFDELTCAEGVKEFAKILHQHHQEIREKQMQVEMIWLSNDRGARVPSDLLETANQEAIEYLEQLA
eukprot:Protomagalhaensia_wolfi_Nauph_80__46@NODE_1028_length_1795_cov_254_321754_g739_i1_p1_GENE_NODE_1028_length_1795_cov_254_321754_g739_i1NODE_1028_length_1795_cov_254_321754_g739_i1_p1_ORF_typecomplete_len274_score61_63Proteasome/PF00227_26/1_6e03Proteasome/PF00227_26/2_6e24Proteasome_A_N/PF10584_9/2_4e12_NODE_1028_length_1795_cov_254_321754_g739_i19231744